MSIPLSSTMAGNVLVHKGGKLEKRQCSECLPNCTKLRLKFQNFPGVIPRAPIHVEGYPSPDLSPARRFAP